MEFEITINGREFSIDVTIRPARLYNPYAGQADTWGWCLYEGTRIVASTARGWDGNLTALGEAVYVASVIAAGNPISLDDLRRQGLCNLEGE